MTRTQRLPVQRQRRELAFSCEARAGERVPQCANLIQEVRRRARDQAQTATVASLNAIARCQTRRDGANRRAAARPPSSTLTTAKKTPIAHRSSSLTQPEGSHARPVS